MTTVPHDAVGELHQLVAELEQRLESSFAAHDEAIARQAATAKENTRLRAEIGTARDRQRASAGILSTIASVSGDAERSLYQIAETSVHLFGATSATIQIAEGDGWDRIIRVGESSKRIGAAVPQAQLRIGGRNMPGTIVAENRQIHVPDLDNVDPAIADWPGLPPARAAGTRSMSGSPLRREGKAIGALIVYRDRFAPFTDEEMALQQSFADQAAIAFENARLFNETREALERQTATADILKVIASSPSDVQPVFEAIAISANRLVGGFSTAVYSRLDDAMHLSAFTRTSAAADAALTASSPLLLSSHAWGQQIRDGEVVHIPDIDIEWAALPALREVARLRGFRSLLLVPLLRDGMSIGMINVARAEPGKFDDNHVQLLQTFADQALIAIENARLFDEVQARTEDLRESLQQQTATAEVLKVISRSAFDLQTVLDTLVESAARLCDADRACVFQKSGEVYRWVSNYGFSEELIAYADAHPFTAGVHSTTSRVALEGKPIHNPDVLADPNYKASEYQRLGNYRTMLGIPLLREGAPIGVFILAREQVRPFSDRQIELVTSFADQAVIAIENVRLFDEVQARTRELAASLEELRTAQDRLVQTEKLASLGQLTAGIAHEIKNPLNFVNNFAALSAELIDELNDALAPATLEGGTRQEVDELTELLKANLEKVVQHGKRADSIVKNMLLHSREGAGEHRATDINALLDESLNLAYHGARAERPQFNVTLQRSFDATAGMVEVFPQEITRVFLNLISNGFYAVTKRGAEPGNSGFEPVVHVTTTNLGDTVEVRIRDNGTGIPEAVKQKMFNPFFTTKPAGEGTGLGLSMSHDIIVKQHGGSIDVATEPGRFTEFIVVLPRTSHLQENKLQDNKLQDNKRGQT